MFLLAEEAEAVTLSTMRLLVVRALLFAGVIGLCTVNAAPVVLIALIVLLAGRLASASGRRLLLRQ
jgi:hypothetical protein